MMKIHDLISKKAHFALILIFWKGFWYFKKCSLKFLLLKTSTINHVLDQFTWFRVFFKTKLDFFTNMEKKQKAILHCKHLQRVKRCPCLLNNKNNKGTLMPRWYFIAYEEPTLGKPPTKPKRSINYSLYWSIGILKW